jgi:hypothetical protein
MTAQWKLLLDHVMSVPEQIYEHWNSSVGWDNITQYGDEYGENGVSWCVIFEWDMYHDMGLDDAVPKTDNVSDFSNWAQQHGQWSEYPSVGAWVNFGNGAHTEMVVGFDATTVYTKGGNSVQAGATDNGQGNGVWSHSHARTSSYVTGYFAPHFPDGVCPPTADPADPRGGAAQDSYSWPGPDAGSDPAPAPTPAPTPTPPDAAPARYQVTINGLAYGYGAHGDQVTLVGQALVAKGFGSHYQQGPGPDWSDADTENYADYQRSLNYSGGDADGVPGETSLRQLLGYLPSATSTVSLSAVIDAARVDPPAEQGHLSHPDDVRLVQNALVAEGLLDGNNPAWGRGSFGSMTVSAYSAWQQRIGYSGPAADGVPGRISLTGLGSRHGFIVTTRSGGTTMSDAARRTARTVLAVVLGLLSALPELVHTTGLPSTLPGLGTALGVSAVVTRLLASPLAEQLLPSWLRKAAPSAPTPSSSGTESTSSVPPAS